MKRAVTLLERLMGAVAFRSGAPGGSPEWDLRIREVSEALDAAFEEARAAGGLTGDRLRIHFRADEVILENEPLWALRGWPWIARLNSGGIGGIQLARPVSQAQLENFIVDLEAALAGEGIRDVRSEPDRWGAFDVTLLPQGGEEGEVDAGVEGAGGDAPITSGSSLEPFPDEREVEAAAWIHDRVAQGASLPHVEAEALVRVLATGLDQRPRSILRLFQPRTPEDYPATHATNTALLAMMVADERGYSAREAWEIGLAGLLHDIGMSRISNRLIHAERRLEGTEREIIEDHPREGARMLMKSGVPLVVPAIVAWEHHLRFDGGGYPKRAHLREPHPASRIVHLTSTYAALRADRPYSPGWDHPRALAFIQSGLGGAFDPDVGGTFIRILSEWNPPLATSPRPSSPDTACEGPEGPD